MKLKLAFSPCPNDTFIFDALVNKRIDCGDYEFENVIADVEALNKSATEGKSDITKISMAAFPSVSDSYVMLDSGSAFGNSNGPLLVSKRKTPISEVEKLRIAIPGLRTTAHLLLSIAFPKAIDKKEFLFSDIENAVLHESVDAGLIIHEGRFTYQEKGLKKIIDLGEYWEKQFHQLIPLGGVAARRDLPLQVIKDVNTLIHESVSYAFQHPEKSKDFIKYNAQEMEDEIVQKHIALYVNEFSVNMGEKGRNAIRFLFQKGLEYGLLPEIKKNIFID